MQQDSRTSAHPRSQQRTYPLALPKPVQLCELEHRNEDFRTGLSGAGKAQRSLEKATSHPFLTRTTAPLSVVSLSPQTDLNHPISTVATSIASSDTKTLHGNPSVEKDFPSIIVEPSTSLQPSPFPLRSFITYRPKLLTFEEQLSYGQYAPAYFSSDSWKKIWNSRKVNLDDLSFAAVLQTSKSQPPRSTSFRYETEFTGYLYRVAIDPTKCHSSVRIQCGTIVDVANLNTAQGKYVVDTCQLVRNGLSFFPVHYRECDQGFTSADDFHHYSFILAIPSSFSSNTDSPFLQLPLKPKPVRSFYPFVMCKLYISSIICSLTSKICRGNHDTTPRASTEMDFRPPSSPHSQRSDSYLDITDDDTPSERGRKLAYWFAQP